MPPASPSEVRETLRRLTHGIVGEMWRVTVFVYQALRAALNPVALRDVPRAMAAYLEHISRRNEQKRPKKIDLLLRAGVPARLPDAIVEQIRGHESDGLVKLPTVSKALRRGQSVEIARGSFRGHVGLYDGMTARDRCHVLLALLGRQTRVELALGDVAPRPNPPAPDIEPVA